MAVITYNTGSYKLTLPQAIDAIEARIASGEYQRSIQGQHGSNAFLKVCDSLKTICEDNKTANQAIKYFNAKYCEPPWDGKELQHKLDESDKFVYQGIPHKGPEDKEEVKDIKTDWLKSIVSESKMVIAFLTGVDAAKAQLDALFKEGEYVNIGYFNVNKDGLKKVTSVCNCTVKDLKESLEQDNDLLEKHEHGVCIRVNPFAEEKGEKEANVSAYRNMLVEMDLGTLQEQWNVIQSLGLPVASVVYSGGAGLHCVIKVNADSAQQYREYRTFIQGIFSAFPNVVKDLDVMDAVHYTRFAGHKRQGVEQMLYAVNLNTHRTFVEWKKHIEEKIMENAFPYESFGLFNLVSHETERELIKNDFLTTQTVSAFYARSGIGKSVLSLQLSVGWGLGMNMFGFQPTAELKSILFSWEDTHKRTILFREGIRHGMSLTDKDIFQINNKVIIPSRKVFIGKSMLELVDIIRAFIIRFRPDIIWLNPITAFLENIKDNGEAKAFRGLIDKMAIEYDTHFVLVSHISKQMKNKDTGKRFNVLDMYDVIGASTYTNWPRSMWTVQESEAVLPDNPEKELYTITATKGEGDLRWKTNDGKHTNQRYISRSDEEGLIYFSDHFHDMVSKKDYEEKEQIERLRLLIPLLPDSISLTPLRIKAGLTVYTLDKLTSKMPDVKVIAGKYYREVK